MRLSFGLKNVKKLIISNIIIPLPNPYNGLIALSCAKK